MEQHKKNEAAAAYALTAPSEYSQMAIGSGQQEQQTFRSMSQNMAAASDAASSMVSM
jgi:hypothetical protein